MTHVPGFDPMAAPAAIAEELEAISAACAQTRARMMLFGVAHPVVMADMVRLPAEIQSRLRIIDGIERDLKEAMS